MPKRQHDKCCGEWRSCTDTDCQYAMGTRVPLGQQFAALVRETVAEIRRMPERFVAWSEDLERRRQSGEFGKWPWQDIPSRRDWLREQERRRERERT